MSLLLLFGGGGGGPDLEIPITTPPVPGVGVVTQIEAVGGGEWRMSLEVAEPPGSTWYDLTEFYAGDRHQFGAQDYKGDARARLVEVQLQIDNQQAAELAVNIDILAPWGQDTTDLFGTNVRLGAGLLMRLSLVREVDDVVEDWLPLWTGRVEQWGDAAGARGQIRRHVVNVVDTIADLANVPTLIDEEAPTWGEYFTDVLLPAAGWQFGVDVYGDVASTSGFPIDTNMVAAVNRLDGATDVLGLVWRSRRDGKLVIHPAPWDTTNVARYPNPLLDVYPAGLMFSYAPDFTDIEYIADDDAEPFGIIRNVSGIINSIIITDTATGVAIDNPTSIGRYGVRPYTATWIGTNPPVADDLLADRAFAESQALPLRTTIDHEGFWPALAMVDYLDPVTVLHADNEDGLVVTGTGVIRNIIEERTVRAAGLINWQSTVQIDLDSTETSEALLPVEDLELVSTSSPMLGGPSGAEFSWTNPTQPSITPTEVQYRILNRSLIWVSDSYPGVGADGVTVSWLSAATQYTFQVRLIRRVDGIVTNFSPSRQITFTTPAIIFPGPIVNPDDPDGPPTGELPSDPDCEDETWELQERGDDMIWTTVETYTHDDVTLFDAGPPATYTPTVAPTYEAGKWYRFLQLCDGDVVLTGPEFDPPDSVLDPCTIPPALSIPPYDDAIVYVPKVCTGFEDGNPDYVFEGMVMVEAVSNIAGVHGDALAGFGQLEDGPDYVTLVAIADPGWSDAAGGILAYGECPQIVGVTGDKSILARVNVVDDSASCVLFECAAMQLTATAVGGGGWRPGVTVHKVGSTVSLAGVSVLDAGTTYNIAATHDYETGDIMLYVNAILDNSVGGTDNVATINALPIWRVGAPPESWITDCALWDRVLTAGELPAEILPFNDTILGVFGADVIVLTDYRKVAGVHPTTYADLSGNGHTGSRSGAVTDAAGPDGGVYPDFNDGSADVDYGDHNDFTISTTEGKTFIFLVKPNTTTASQALVSKVSGASTWEYVIYLDAYDVGSTNFKLGAVSYASGAGGAVIRRETLSNFVIDKDAWNLIVVAFPPITGTADDYDIYVNSSSVQATSVATTSNNGTGNTAASMRTVANTVTGAVDYEGIIARYALIRHQRNATEVAALVASLQEEGFL